MNSLLRFRSFLLQMLEWIEYYSPVTISLEEVVQVGAAILHH